jgi:hypothetical protein
MPEVFLQLSKKDRADALGVAAEQSRRPAHLLEKDVWVVWALRTMFQSPFGPHLVFKGGTSLSKAYAAIKRFSEDIDLTYDIRRIAADLVGENNEEALPPTKSQEKRWTRDIRERLTKWAAEDVLPLLQRAIADEKLSATALVDPEDTHVLRIEYEHTAEGTGYVKPVVILEFGARSTGEPCAPIAVQCDMAEFMPALTFPTSTPRVMRVERTFWEKATAVHVYCQGGRLAGSRFSRHWYDLCHLDSAGHAASALTMRDVADRVARHKGWFFPAKDAGGMVIEYASAVGGKMRLLPPSGKLLDELADDYRKMLEDGLLLDDSTAFERILEQCKELEDRVNKAMALVPMTSAP